MNRAVFLDRDGTINKEIGYLKNPGDLYIFPEAIDAIKLINKTKMKAVVITNQSGVARGYFSEEGVENIHRILKKSLEKKGAYLDRIYYCPHHPEFGPPEYRKTCKCRKPAPGMLEKASKDLGIDLSRSYVIGDKKIDIELANNVHAKGILVLTGYGKEEIKTHIEESRFQPYYIAKNILEAVNWILLDLKKNIDGNS